MRGVKRVLWGLLVCVLAIVLLTMGALGIILYTETGSRGVINLVSDRLEALQIGQFQGKLGTEAVLRQVQWSGAPGARVDEVRLAWDLTTLLSGKLHLKLLKVDGVHVTLPSAEDAKPEAEPQGPIALPREVVLPVTVIVDDIALSNIVISPAVAPASQASGASPPPPQEFKQITLRDVRLTREHFSFAELAVDGMGVQASLGAQVQAKFPFPLQANLTFSAKVADLPQAQGKLDISGDLKQLTVSHSVSSPYNVSADISVTPNIRVPPSPLRQPKLDLQAMMFSGRFGVAQLDTQVLGLTPEAHRLSANASFEGTLADIQATLDADAAPALYPKVRLLAQMRFAEKRLRLRDVRITSPELPTRVNASGEIALDGPAPRLDITANWQDVRWPLQGERIDVTSPTGRVAVKGTLAALVADLEVAVNQQGTIRGQVKREQSKINAALNWQALAYPMNDPQVSSQQGALHFHGTPEAFATSLKASVATPDFPKGNVQLEGRAVDKIFDLKALQVNAGGLQVGAKGRINYQQDLQSALTLTIKDFDPSLFVPTFPGQIGATVETEFLMGKHAYRANIKRLNAQGTLRDQPLKVDAKLDAKLAKGDVNALLKAFKQKKAMITVQQLDATLGRAAIQVSGTVTDTVQSSWEINIPELGQVVPAAEGAFQCTGKAVGPILAPTLTVSTTGTNLQWQQIALNALTVAGNVSVDVDKTSSLTAEMKGLRVNNVKVSEATASVKGFQNAHQLRVSVASDVLNTTLVTDGRYEEEQWHFTLKQGQLVAPGMPAWSLVSPASGVVGATSQRLTRQCWQSEPATVCLLGEQTAGTVRAKVSVSDLPASHFKTWLPEGLVVNSALGGDIDLAHDLKKSLPELSAKFLISEGSIEYEDLSNLEPDLQSIPLRESHVTVLLKDEALTVDARAGFSPVDYLTADLRIPAGEAPFNARPLQGDVKFVMKDLRLIDHLVDPIDQLRGEVEATVQMRGSLAQPNFSGGVSVANAQVNVIDAALALRDIQADVQVKPKGATLRLQAKSHEGNVLLKGNSDSDFTRLTDFAKANVTAQLQGKNFRVLNKRQQKVDISPDLNIQLKDQAVYVDGVVRIPFADISNIAATPPSGVSVSDDQVIIDEEGEGGANEAPDQKAPLPVHATVRLEMGEKVHFNEFGLDAVFGGAIVIKEKPGQVTSASGEFRIEKGRFRKLGQDLVIRKGRVIFAGPVTKPGLDLEAVRVINSDLVAGIRARGPISQIEQFTLFSEPGGLTQADILSYITTGRPLSGGSEGETNALTQASMALAMTGGKYLTENFGDKLGVDEIGIDTAPGEDTSQAALTIGKYLSPKLYVSSGVGLFQPITTLKLRYSINDKWKFVSEASGAKSSADFVYEIESGD